MNYTDNERSCRVDFWKDTGKWYTTEAVIWTGEFSSMSIHQEFKKSLIDHFGKTPRMIGMRATCLNPFAEHAHPISILIDESWFN